MTTKEALRKIAQVTDEALAPLFEKERGLNAEVLRMNKDYLRAEKAGSPRAAHLKAVMDKTYAELETAREEMAPLLAIARAGAWRRFIFVPGGHVHNFGCSTLHFTTARIWIPEYSGADEAELVEAAGERACTVCFPSAPVDRPTTIPELVKEREEREAEAAERAAKREAAEAAKITVGRRVFKTQRGAENEIGWKIELVVSRRYMPAQTDEHRANLDSMAADDLAMAREIAEAIAEAVPGYSAQAILEKKFAQKVKQYRKIPHYTIPADASL